MRTKSFAAAALSGAIAVGSVGQAAADADGLVGGIIGGVIGGVIVNEAQKNRQQTRTRTVYAQPSVSSSTRAYNRETQTALNYFGFNAGPADGVVGRGTRAAMAQYQAHLGYPATGELTPYERDFLVTSYQRALAGGATTAQLIATNPMGAKGLLVMFRDQALGVQSPQMAGGLAAPLPQAPAPAPVAPAAGTVMASAPGAVAPPPVFGSAEPAPAPVPSIAASAPAALPTFLAPAAGSRSLASTCNEVGLVTTSNGFTTAATMTDPRQVLQEQFCLARTYTTGEGEKLAARVAGVSAAQIETQCASFGPLLAQQVGMLGTASVAKVMASTLNFIQSSGMSAEQLEATAKICLSVGYRTDNMPVALASALVLTGLGRTSYAELLGHHLALGFGVPEAAEPAKAWYTMGIEAVEGGAPQIVNPGQPERTALLRKAALGGGDAQAVSAPAAAALPVFKVQP